MTQVQSLPINISGIGGNNSISMAARHTSPPGFGLGLPSPPPEREDDEGFPKIRTESVDYLLRSGIAEAAIASAANQPDAEAAFFVADLGHIYRQHKRWQKCLPNITPFYGE